MKFNLNTPVKNIYGEDIIDSDSGEKKTPATVGKLCILALVSDIPNKPLSGEEKFKNNGLAQRIIAGDVVEFTADEVANIKKRVGDLMSTQIVGFIWNFFESAEQPEKKDK